MICANHLDNKRNDKRTHRLIASKEANNYKNELAQMESTP